MRTRFHVLTTLALACVLSPLALLASSSSDPGPRAAQTAAPAAEAEAQAPALAAPSWTHVGCIQLGSECLDVFADKKGTLWVCDECFTTQNPSPGKCRKLTNDEIANAAWCA